jgi:predicted transcriptional regulator
MTQHVSTNEMTTDIVAAFVSHTNIQADELPDLVRRVRATLAELVNGPAPAADEASKAATAAKVRKSVTHDHLVCLEDGLKLRSLKQHLRVKHGLTPDEYRAKWGLAADYPMAAPGYAKARSEFAKSMGLSRYRKGAKAKA